MPSAVINVGYCLISNCMHQLSLVWVIGGLVIACHQLFWCGLLVAK